MAEHGGLANDYWVRGPEDNELFPATGDDFVRAGGGNDLVGGGDGNDTIYGEDGNDRLVGDRVGYVTGGRDLIDGGNGDDAMLGGMDADLMHGGSGADLMIGDLMIGVPGGVFTDPELHHGDYFPGNDDMHGGDGDDRMYGNEGDDTLHGDAGLDQLYGGTGNDLLIGGYAGDTTGDRVDGGDGNDGLYGADGDDVMFGGAGNDAMVGGRGADEMFGGTGDDSYVVDSPGDLVIEAADGGIDHVASRVTMTLAANVENLTLDAVAGAIDGTGNALDNRITGNGHANQLSGGGGNDTLFGGAGDDRLDGGAGTDTMAGGVGNDAYLVDTFGESVVEAAGQGLDTVESLVSHTLAANVENLVLGAADAAVVGTGNASDNLLAGNAGHNLLNGLGGADTMRGGLGDDHYLVDQAGDIAIEAAGEGYDTVHSSVSLTLADNIEQLVLNPTFLSIDGTGNTLANVLVGNSTDNRLDGGAGADAMFGGGGDDIYIVDDSQDRVQESAGEGTDTVFSNVSYTLGAELEQLSLTGDGALFATGNALDNTLTGNGARNTLSGGAGNDLLQGGGGADTLLGDIGDDVFVLDPLDLTLAGKRLDGGAGSDTLRFSEAGQLLDLTRLNNDRAVGLEAMDLTGSGDNALVLKRSDLLALSDTDVLRIDGDSGDALKVLGQGWSAGADLSLGDQLYHSFVNNGATLLVDADVTAAFG
jgi:Ca2+-binding RTX toxin-like protein